MCHAYPNQTDLISYAHTQAEAQANAFQLPEKRETFACVLTSEHGGVGYLCVLSVCIIR